MLFKPTDDQLRQAIDFIFNRYDKDHNNVLDYQEVKEVVSDAFRNVNNAREITDEDIKKFVGAVDTDADGRISKQELLMIFKKIIDSQFK